VLGPIKNMEGYTHCIVAQEDHLPTVQCHSNGTFTLIVLRIGDRQNCTFEIDPGGVHTRLPDIPACKVLAVDHGTLVSCLVYNKAVPGGIMSEQLTLYVTGTSLYNVFILSQLY